MGKNLLALPVSILDEERKLKAPHKRHYREVWKQEFKLIVIFIQLSEMHGGKG